MNPEKAQEDSKPPRIKEEPMSDISFPVSEELEADLASGDQALPIGVLGAHGERLASGLDSDHSPHTSGEIRDSCSSLQSALIRNLVFWVQKSPWWTLNIGCTHGVCKGAAGCVVVASSQGPPVRFLNKVPTHQIDNNIQLSLAPYSTTVKINRCNLWTKSKRSDCINMDGSVFTVTPVPT